AIFRLTSGSCGRERPPAPGQCSIRRKGGGEPMKDFASAISLDDFRHQVEVETTPSMCPSAIGIEKNIPIYDGKAVSDLIAPEWAGVIGRGPGVFVVKRAFTDPGAIDAASEAFRAIIAHERAAGIAAGDHFAKAGANDRIWNSLQK